MFYAMLRLLKWVDFSLICSFTLFIFHCRRALSAAAMLQPARRNILCLHVRGLCASCSFCLIFCALQTLAYPRIPMCPFLFCCSMHRCSLIRRVFCKRLQCSSHSRNIEGQLNSPTKRRCRTSVIARGRILRLLP